MSTNNYGLCDAVAEPEPAALTEVAPFECCASTAPAALAEAEFRRVSALAPPLPARLIEEVGFCAAVFADGAGAAPGLLAGTAPGLLAGGGVCVRVLCACVCDCA